MSRQPDPIPDPPPRVELANIADAVAKFRSIGGALLIGSTNYTADSDTDAGGAALSAALRPFEQDPIKDRLATLAGLEDIYNDALQCQWRNMVVDHLPNPPGVRNPKENCRPTVSFSAGGVTGSIDGINWVK